MTQETMFEIVVESCEIITLDKKIAFERFLKERLEHALIESGIHSLKISTDSYSRQT